MCWLSFQSCKTEDQTLEEVSNHIKHCFPVIYSRQKNGQVLKITFCYFSLAITDNQINNMKSNQNQWYSWLKVVGFWIFFKGGINRIYRIWAERERKALILGQQRLMFSRFWSTKAGRGFNPFFSLYTAHVCNRQWTVTLTCGISQVWE